MCAIKVRQDLVDCVLLCVGESEGEAIDEFVHVFLCGFELIRACGICFCTSECVLHLDIEHFFKGKALACRLRVLRFFRCMNVRKCFLQLGEFVSVPYGFGDWVLDMFKHAAFKAFEYRMVEPLARHPFALAIDRVDGLIDFRFSAFED